ncbi:MAG: hypothetical protein IJ426_04570 [Clostridia bacterium]|nr:hypothetical protein [Clostridia bacterium]
MKFARIIFFLALSSLAAVYARAAQLLYLTEKNTGFFTPDGKTGAIALSVFIVLAVFCSAGISFFTRRNPAGPPDNAIAPKVGAGFLAVGCLFEAFFVDYVSSAGVLILLTRIMAVLAAVSLLAYILRGAVPALTKAPKMIYIPVLLFFAFKLVTTFTAYSAVSAIADNVFYIAFLCLALVFALLFLKLENGIRPGRSAYRLFPAAIAVYIIANCCFVPQIAAILIGKGDYVHSDPNTFVLPITVAVFSLCYVFSLYSKKNIIRRKRNTPRLESNTSYHEMSGQFVSGSDRQRRKK